MIHLSRLPHYYFIYMVGKNMLRRDTMITIYKAAYHFYEKFSATDFLWMLVHTFKMVIGFFSANYSPQKNKERGKSSIWKKKYSGGLVDSFKQKQINRTAIVHQQNEPTSPKDHFTFPQILHLRIFYQKNIFSLCEIDIIDTHTG